MNYGKFFGAIIIGIAIQFIFLIIDISSNLTYNPSKIVTTIVFGIILLVLNHFLFFPKRFYPDRLTKKEKNTGFSKREVSLIHFVILGALFIYAAMLIFNPMALSAYDIINLNYNQIISVPFLIWPSYGFTYYIFLILFTLIISYFIIEIIMRSVDTKYLRFIIICTFLISTLFTALALFIIEGDNTIISTIYTSTFTVFTVFSLTFYFRYLFTFYRFKNSKRLVIGIIIFFITSFLLIIVHVQILWYEYISLLIDNVIQISIATVLIIVLELRTFNLSIRAEFLSNNELKRFGLSYFILLVIAGFSFTTVVLSHPFPSSIDETPKVMIWNIHNAIGIDDLFDLDRLVEDIKTQDPDILGLNEVDIRLIKTASIDIASYFAHKLNMYYVYGPTLYKHYGNVILSKYPIISNQVIQLPTVAADKLPRVLIKANILVNSSIWTIYVTHLSTDSANRLVQVPYIINEIEKEPAFERTVWMGDLNLESSSSEYGLINSTSILNFTDTYRYLNSDPGYTGDFDDNLVPQKRIDYILCSPDLTPITSTVYCSIGSDHCAVITQF
jgi:endonuclease/exonuclease/phosphatase family metal-dependent hydrolase